MKKKTLDENDFDIFVIGGGVNGAGILRDAAGRGISVGWPIWVILAQQRPLHPQNCFMVD